MRVSLYLSGNLSVGRSSLTLYEVAIVVVAPPPPETPMQWESELSKIGREFVITFIFKKNNKQVRPVIMILINAHFFIAAEFTGLPQILLYLPSAV